MDECGRDQRPRVRLEKFKACCVMSVVTIDVRVQRSCVDDQCDDCASFAGKWRLSQVTMWVTSSENDVLAPVTSQVYDPAPSVTASVTVLGPVEVATRTPLAS